MRALIAAMCGIWLAAAPAWASGPVLVEKGASVTAVVDEEDFDGLAATSGSGQTYLVLTPPGLDYADLAAFHRRFKKRAVVFRGDVYRDERGLSIAVDRLPDREADQR